MGGQHNDKCLSGVPPAYGGLSATRFGKDVFIDVVGYRRYGHNELDEPAFTQPTTYGLVRKRASIVAQYGAALRDADVLTQSEIDTNAAQQSAELDRAFNDASSPGFAPRVSELHLNHPRWSKIVHPPVALAQGTLDTPNKVVTAVQDEDLLRHIGRVSVQSTSIPNNKGTIGVTIHDRLARTFVEARLAKMSATESSDTTDRERHIDWATAEALAFGSLLVEGHNVRLCGQDAGRGTFSHRHARLVDQLDQTTFATPLNHIRPPGQQGLFTVLNSPLSELAVLGFEYGYSVEDPNTLCIWEAQFGDFFNGAQIMIDAFISSGEDKWLRQSGLVVLLPHGYDGAGAEHSSARLERFLQLCDTDSTLASARTNTIPNMHVIFPTTAANYFHALRRQLKRNYLKPLIVMAPKTLLRAPEANSPLSHFSDPTKASFSPILPDPDILPNDVDAIRTVFLCSGKFFYDLQRERNVRQRKDIAIIRLEELSPFPHELLRAELKRFSQATKYVWVQEEPQNMGAWSYVDPRLRNLVGIPPRLLSCASPAPLSASAVGSSFFHSTVTKQLIQKCFG